MTDDGNDLKAIFLETRPMLLRMLVARLGNTDDAEDTLQDMWLRIDQLAVCSIGQPAGFLYRVAANLATDRRIATTRRSARDTAWHDVQPMAEEIPDAERAMMAREKLDAVENAMADMPERMRTALRMFRFEEQPQRAIAETLGISVSGVEKLLQRAYRQIYHACEIFSADDACPRRLGCEGKPSREQ
ncbi:RNA polymerase sigma factor [Sphingomonas aliaeris]|uniref:RNA polymerase sigma factor n=1 Tax=Sphingomonas aliaeris TaxID=2759526 RepID=A0A974NX12_9SPHN|nr:RNA polymerase sigma factor [Sphingomonas aliaeris]QQV78599.1 RNA polymerase sigma factor [Sphingomonas aliaeris]